MRKHSIARCVGLHADSAGVQVDCCHIKRRTALQILWRQLGRDGLRILLWDDVPTAMNSSISLSLFRVRARCFTGKEKAAIEEERQQLRQDQLSVDRRRSSLIDMGDADDHQGVGIPNGIASARGLLKLLLD